MEEDCFYKRKSSCEKAHGSRSLSPFFPMKRHAEFASACVQEWFCAASVLVDILDPLCAADFATSSSTNIAIVLHLFVHLFDECCQPWGKEGANEQLQRML